LSAFSRNLSIALSSVRFYDETDQETIDHYRSDLKFFFKLRASVRRRYAEVVDFSEYEPRIQKLLDTYVGTGEVEPITPLVNIFDQDLFMKEVDKVDNPAAKADIIAHRTLKTIYERMDEDPVFYNKFSEMIKRAIKEYQDGVLQAAEYLNQVSQHMHAVLNRTGDDLPKVLEGEDVAKAYYGVINEQMESVFGEGIAASISEKIGETAIAIDKIINQHRIVKWVDNIDVQNRIKTAIEDYLFEVQEELNISLDFDTIDNILDRTIEIAKVRKP